MDRVNLRYLSRRNLDIYADGYYKIGGKKYYLVETISKTYLEGDSELNNYISNETNDLKPIDEVENEFKITPVVDPILDNKGSKDNLSLSSLSLIATSSSDNNHNKNNNIVSLNPTLEATKLICQHTGSFEAINGFNNGNIIILNFASAKKPGGGFLNGAMAQEEALCYRSNLYSSLVTQKDFYNPSHALPITYTHRMIYSENVTIFRDDEYALLYQPYQVNIITCAAVNRKICKSDSLADKVMKERAERILYLAKMKKADHLVLGAWGCGVFGNKITFVINMFLDLIKNKFNNVFKTVIFPSPVYEHYIKMNNIISHYKL